MIGVTIIAMAQPGKGQELAEAWFRAGKRTMAQDPECKSFVVSIDRENPDQVIASEIYTSQEAVDAHNSSDLAKELLPVLMSLAAGPPTVYTGDVLED